MDDNQKLIMKNEDDNHFSKTPHKLIKDVRSSAVDIAVYAALRMHEDWETGTGAYPSHSTIGDRIGRSRTTVWKSCRRLQEWGFIAWTGKRGETNRYSFLHCLPEDDQGRPVASTQHVCTHNATGVVSSKQQKQEPKLYKSKRTLYHYKDKCHVDNQDGSITIKTCENKWVGYSGHDEDGFHFGNLTGIDARKAAIKYFAKKP